MTKHKILLIDDEIENLNLLRRTFIRDYITVTASSGNEALKILEEKSDFTVIISDQRMQGLSGTDFFKIIEQKGFKSIKILLTAYTDVEALVDAINDGKVHKYVTKPWSPDDLKFTVKRAIEIYELARENEKLLKDLSQKNLELEKMKVYTEERVEEERLRISRELHDDTCQALASININLEICTKLLKKQSDLTEIEGVLFHIDGIKKQLKTTINQIRRISMDLRPPELDSLGFVATLEHLINRYIDLVGTPKVKLSITGDIITLPQKLELALFRLIQEALNNINKHAKASLVEVFLNYKEDFLEVIINDNGIGFVIPNNYSELLQDGHLGLVGMQERIKQFNGQISIKSIINQGTIIKVNVSCVGGTFE